MKQLIGFIKSPVGRFHSSFAVFILFNLLSGLVGRTGYYPGLATVHFIAGLFIVAAPAVFLLVNKNRSMILKAFKKMAWFHKSDFTNRKLVPFLFKATALAIVLATLGNAVTGLLYRAGVAAVPAFSAHLIFFYVSLAAVPLHIVLGLLLHRRPKH